jgi:hypothetical protein
MLCQRNEVLHAIAQRREEDRDALKMSIKVFAQSPRGDELLRVATGGHDEADCFRLTVTFDYGALSLETAEQ